MDRGENTWHIELKLDHYRTCHSLELECMENYSSRKRREAVRLLSKMGKHYYIYCVVEEIFVYTCLADKRKVYSYKDIECSSLEMVGMRRLFLARNINKERHFDIIYIINDSFLHHL